MTAQSVGHAELKTRARERDEDNLKLKAENEALGLHEQDLQLALQEKIDHSGQSFQRVKNILKKRVEADKEFQEAIERLELGERGPTQYTGDLSDQIQSDSLRQAEPAPIAPSPRTEVVAQVQAKIQTLEGRIRDQDAQITAAVNRDWTAVQPHLDNVLRETNVVLVQQRDVLMKDLDQAHRKNDDLQKLTQGLMEKQEDSESSNVAKLEKEQQDLVQLRVRVSALGKAAEQADIQRKRLEYVRRAENRERELKFEPGNDKLRAKAKALELTCNDMKPKIAELQAVVQRARRTREAFAHRWDEIKRLTYSTHKEQQLLAALAEIVNEELLE